MSTNDPMTQDQLDAIQGRLDARTPGEWEASGREIDALAPTWGEVVSTEVNCMNYCYGGTGRGVEHAEDAELIAHAPQDLADLLAEVERLRALTTVDDAKIERVARELAHLEPGEAWPTTRELGGVPRSGRDEEYRTAMREWAQKVINITLGAEDDEWI